MKRLLSFFLVTIMVAATIPVSLFSALAAEASFVSVVAPAETVYTGDSENDSFTVSFALTLAPDINGVAGYEIILEWDAQYLALTDGVSVKSDGLYTVNLDRASSGLAKIVVANATDAIGAGTLFEAAFYPLTDYADAVISAKVERMSTASGFISCDGCETAVSLLPTPPVVINIEEHPILTDGNTVLEENWSENVKQNVVLIRNDNCKTTDMDVELIYPIGKTVFVDGISLCFYHCPEAMIGYPEGNATVLVSSDGQTYTQIGVFAFAAADLAAGKYGTVENTFALPASEASYVKVCFSVGSSTDVLGSTPADGKKFWEFIALTEISLSRFCEHSYEVTDSAEATCTTDGFKKYTCFKCNDSYTENFPSFGHAPSKEPIVQEPTCTEHGSITTKCDVCGEVISDTQLPATGHTYDRVEIISSLSCTDDGITKYTCSDCLHTYTETVPAKGHTDGTWITLEEATCKATGKRELRCDDCQAVLQTEILAPLPHSNNEGVTEIPPSCEEVGIIRFICLECGDSYTEELPALGHTAGDWVVQQEPTETQNGIEIQKCSVCGKILDTAVLPKYTPILPDADGKPDDIKDLWGNGNATEENITLIANPSELRGANVTLVQHFGELYEIESLTLALYHCADNGIGYPEGYATVLASSDGINYFPVGTFELTEATPAIGKAATVVRTFVFDTAIRAQSVRVLLQIGTCTDILGPMPDGGDRYWQQIGVVSLNASRVFDRVDGDVDGNGVFDAVDYMKLKRYILGTYEFDENELLRSDINHDGDVTAVDYMILKRVHLGTHSFPA